MCSIFGILDIKTDAATLRPIALEMSKNCAIAVQTGQVSMLLIKRFWPMSVWPSWV